MNQERMNSIFLTDVTLFYVLFRASSLLSGLEKDCQNAKKKPFAVISKKFCLGDPTLTNSKGLLAALTSSYTTEDQLNTR